MWIKKAVAKEKVVEKKEVEKTHYNIHLKSFDAAKKIVLIKEVKAILVLGLKEVKTYITI